MTKGRKEGEDWPCASPFVTGGGGGLIKAAESRLEVTLLPVCIAEMGG
jgi:hypothetical protein